MDQDPWNDLKVAYIDVWKKALGVLLGWSQEEVIELAREWSESMDHPSFYHETPIWQIIHLIMPDSLKRKMANEGSKLASVDQGGPRNMFEKLQITIEQPNCFAVLDESFDWSAARARVEAFLGKYGETLDRKR